MPKPRLPDAEIERRLPVWQAMTDLFLDTELDAADYDGIARVLLQSGYPVAELRRIFEQEVTPAFSHNIYAVAGEWAGWDEEFVRERMLESWRPRMSWLRRMLNADARRTMAPAWAEVERRL